MRALQRAGISRNNIIQYVPSIAHASSFIGSGAEGFLYGPPPVVHRRAMLGSAASMIGIKCTVEIAAVICACAAAIVLFMFSKARVTPA